MTFVNTKSNVLSTTPSQLVSFVKNIPKIELHAHLSGSLRDTTVLDLMQHHYSKEDIETESKLCRLSPDNTHDTRTMNECFALFKVLHKIISSKEVLERITYEVLEDFVLKENTMYIELRTTPRAIKDTITQEVICTKSEYLTTVCNAITEFEKVVHALNTVAANVNTTTTTTVTFSTQLSQTIYNSYLSKAKEGISFPFVGAKLIASVDRSSTIDDGFDTVETAAKLQSNGYSICGIDFSGNPYSNLFSTFLPVFQRARELSLPTTIHFAETDNVDDASAILDFKPQRVGHAAIMNSAIFQRLIDLKDNISVEICISSNIACKLHESIYAHPFIEIYRQGLSTTLCTDDKGIFGASITDEWLYTLQFPEFNYTITSNLSKEEDKNCPYPHPTTLQESQKTILLLSRQGISRCFCSSETQAELHRQYDIYENSCM